MRGKKRFKKFLNLCIVTFMILSTFYCTLATSVIRQPSGELPSGGEKLKTFAENFIGSMMWIGYAIAVGMVVFIGIKYIIASADEKASMKGMLVKVFIGSFIIVSAVTITNMLIGIFSAS